MNETPIFTLPLHDVESYPLKLLTGLGKCTKRGSKKCFKCGHLNGTKSLLCKNSQCGVILRMSEEKSKVDLDAIKLVTGNVKQIYSVRVRDMGPDYRGFVQLPLVHSPIKEDNNILTDVALCFVDSCQRLFDDSILKCHEEEPSLNEANPFCQHIKSALKSHNIATGIDVKENVLNSLQITGEEKMNLLLLAEKEGPLVQRVSKHVMAIKCQVTPKHPLGYLHFTFSSYKGKDLYNRYFCSCTEFMLSGTVQDQTKTVKFKCIHYYACIWALSSDEKYYEEFYDFINSEIKILRPTPCSTLEPILKTNKTDFLTKKPTQLLKKKRREKKTNVSKKSENKKCKPLLPKTFPIQIKILEATETTQDKETWNFINWLSYITEFINATMHFQNCGILNTQIFHIPENFYVLFKARIPDIYKEYPSSDIEIFNIMNILHLKEIFDTPNIKLRLSKKFIQNDVGFIEDEKNESTSENYRASIIFFLNVGQSTIDESDNTNNSFLIEWLPNITSITKIGQLKFQYKFGRKSINNIL